jgi:protein-disulfide isomerase
MNMSKEKKPENIVDNTGLQTPADDSRINRLDIPNQSVTVKKSTYNNMIKVIVIAIAVSAFFGGYFIGSMENSVTNQDLLSAIAEIDAIQPSTQDPLSFAQPSPSQPVPLSDSLESQIVRVSADDDPMRGDPNAPITIIEFSDFQCPFCARFHSNTLPLIQEEYIDTGKVNLVYRDFPLQSIHPNALPAAVAAECANEQGKFWEYHDILFEKQSSWNKLDLNAIGSALSQISTEVGLEKQQFDSCLESGKYIDEVQKDLRDGKDYGVTGTPAFFIGNEEDGFEQISGAQSINIFRSIFNQQLSQ